MVDPLIDGRHNTPSWIAVENLLNVINSGNVLRLLSTEFLHRAGFRKSSYGGLFKSFSVIINNVIKSIMKTSDRKIDHEMNATCRKHGEDDKYEGKSENMFPCFFFRWR